MGNFAARKITMQQTDFPFTIPENPEAHIRHFFENHHYSSVWVLCDRNTRRYCLPLIKSFLPTSAKIIGIAAGEESKSIESCQKIWEELSQKKSERSALLICLGGGMVCDLGAFAASVYKRGIDFVLVPTSLLAMSDACLGGKTGIDFGGFKNQIGNFSLPTDIWILPEFLKTLPENELLSGMAEIVKHGLCGNAGSWNNLRKADVGRQNWPKLLSESLSFKAGIVAEDPKEKSTRKILNAGHTVGHALESYFLSIGNPQPHGFCVAAGLVVEGRIALEQGLLSEAELIQVEEFVYATFGVLPFFKTDIPKIAAFCKQDKKNKDGKVLAALFGPIGQCQTDREISEKEIRDGLRYYLGN